MLAKNFCIQERCRLLLAKPGLLYCTVHIPIAVGCPKCGVKASQKCRTAAGAEMYKFHSIRFLVAKREFGL